MKPKLVVVNDSFQKKYRYYLTEAVGKNFHPDFQPDLKPQQMLALGVFGGKYMTDCQKEFPRTWFQKAKLAKDKKDPQLNYFKVNASQSLLEWQKKGWIYRDDPRGWFQWYCRYYMGRRISGEDLRQIKRWKNVRRHIFQIVRHCRKGDVSCRPRQRQALLYWAYDTRKL
jgi:hypothetical protein